MKRLGVIIILFLAFAGLADAAYIAQSEASGTPLICSGQVVGGCNLVAQSAYSHLFGVPLADYGLLFYGAIFVLAALELVLYDRTLRRALQLLAVLGLLSSIYFVFIQIFAVQAFCIYCTASGIISLLVLIFASLIEPLRRRDALDRMVHKAHLDLPPS